MKEIMMNRRQFVKSGIGLLFGLAAGESLVWTAPVVDQAVTKITGRPTGNAGLNEKIEETCKKTPDPITCKENFTFTAEDKNQSIIIAPILESLNQATISGALSIINDPDKPPLNDMLFGTDTPDLGMTKDEILAGTISSLVFGYLHNLTGKGLNKEIIPASLISGGMVFWWLQRRFGSAANILAHSFANFRDINK